MKKSKSKLKINGARLTEHLATDNVYNWLIVEGIKKFQAGASGKLMDAFLIHQGILVED